MRTDIVNGIPKDAERWLYEALHSLALNQEEAGHGFAAIIRGEVPDGSGIPLFNDGLYFKLLGRPGGQRAHGDTVAGGSLTLSSTNHGTKGFMYLGDAQTSAFDETQNFLGLGTSEPTARFHAHLDSTGTSGVNQLGTHFAEYSVDVAGDLKNILALAAYANNGASYDVAFISGGSNPSNGIGSIYFTDSSATALSGTGMRLAYGTYGAESVISTHLQFGGLLDNGSTKNRNLLLVGFNDNCGDDYDAHFNTVWFRSEGTTAAGVLRFGINDGGPRNRIGTGVGDQPILYVKAGTPSGAQYSMAMKIDVNSSTYDAVEYLNVIGGSGSIFGLTRSGHINLYNPGNGALNSYITGASFPFEVNDTSINIVQIQNINAFTDGSGKGTMNMRLGDLQGGTHRWAAISSTRSGEFSVALDRLAIQCKLTMICDGALDLTNTPVFTPPTAMLHIKSTLSTSTRLLTLQRIAAQAVDIGTIFDSDGTTALSGFTKDGAYYLVAGEGAGNWLQSDAAGVGAWTAPGDLSRVDDTNVTLALTGTPTGALLKSVGLTLGWTGVLSVARGGTGSGTAVGAFDAISPLTTLGDTLYHNGTNNVRLGGNITTARQFLSQTGTGLVSAAPIWIGPLASTDLPATVAYTDAANVFTTTQDINPATDVTALKLHSTNQTSIGSLTVNLWEGYNAAGLLVAALRNTGRLQLGANDVTLDAIVKLSLNCSPTQSVNLIQCTDGTDTLFSVGSRGAFVFGTNATTMDAVQRMTIPFSTTQSAILMAFVKAGVTIWRIQSNGNMLVGGSSTNAANVGFEKATFQCSSSETANLARFTSGLTGATDLTVSKTATLTTGRIKTAVLFTDDPATLANAKLLGFGTGNITAGSTRTLNAQDLSGNMMVIGDDPPAVAAGSLGKVDLTGQSANITTTNLSSTPPAGDYYVMVYVQCTTLDAGAGTLTVTIGWTDTVGATTDATITVVLTATGRSSGFVRVKVASGDITYTTAASGAYGNARYAIDVRVFACG